MEPEPRDAADELPHGSIQRHRAGAITVTRSSAGHHVVELVGLQRPPGHTENVQVSALWSLPRTCNAAGWTSSPTGLQVARFQVAVIE